MLRRCIAVVCSLAMITTLLVSPAAAEGPIPQELKQIEAQVATIRGLEMGEPIAGQLLTREEWREQVRENAARVSEEAAGELSTSQRILVLLGYVAPDAPNVFESAIAAQEQVVEGFYSTESKTLNVILNGPQPTVSDRLTYAHEYVHALQDEHFGIRDLNEPAGENSDKLMAVRSLVEGDATLTMVLWAQRHLSQREIAQLSEPPSEAELEASGQLDLPPVILRSLQFPYNEGAFFVLALYREGGFDAIDRAYQSPPLSTAEILHPERYLQGYGPVDAEFPRIDRELAGGPWFETYRNTLGELDLRVLLEQFGNPLTAERATTGWAGDEYAYMTNADDEDLLLLRTIWDTPTDAREFADALANAIGVRYRSEVTVDDSVADQLTIDTVESAVTIRTTGTEVLVAVGPTAAVTTQAVDTLEASIPVLDEAA